MHHKTHQQAHQEPLSNHSQQNRHGTTAPQGQPCQGLSAEDNELTTHKNSVHTHKGASKGTGERDSKLDQNVSAEGTTSSNTVPSNCINDNNTKILRTGIDSLYVSYQGELTTESSVKLNTLKKLAQSSEPQDVALAQYVANDHVFDVSDRGRHPFAFILSDNWYRIEIAKLGALRAPLAHSQISSELLTIKGAEHAVTDLTSIVDLIGVTSNEPNVSRVDLCVDFITDHPLETIIDTDWVTKAKDMDRYTVQRQFSGWVIGRGKISARLYNKTLEMNKKPRPYLEDLWRQSGWDGHQDVWRLEFQIRRDCLRELGVITFGSLMQKLSGLWNYSTQDWLRLSIPNQNDKTQTRWPTASVWEALQNAEWLGDKELNRITLEKGRPPSHKYLFHGGLGAFHSFMAMEGIGDPSEGALAFLRAAKEYHDGREYFTGLTYYDYVAQKVALKVKAYNAYRNLPTTKELHPVDDAMAKAYRKQRDGE